MSTPKSRAKLKAKSRMKPKPKPESQETKRKIDPAYAQDEIWIRSYSSLKNLLSVGVVSGFLISIYTFYLVFSLPNKPLAILAFVLGLFFTGTLYYCVRLLGEKRRKAMTIYVVAFGYGWALSFIIRTSIGQPIFISQDVFILLFSLLIIWWINKLITQKILT